MATYKEVGEKVTNLIVSMAEKGEKLPWVRPWSGGTSPFGGGAVSYTTGRPYSFINQLFLGCEGEWITFNKCKELGGRVKKGAKSRMIYFAKTITKEVLTEDGKTETKTFPIFQNYLVFNVNDCEGIVPKRVCTEGKKPEVVFADCDEAEALINRYVAMSGVSFLNNISSSRAFYSVGDDKVVVPNKEQFKVMNEYYSTVFHEFVHSTLTKERCNRPQDENGRKACFGNAPYAKEELVAELGACMLLSSLGLSTETTERNSVAYLQSWLTALKQDVGMIVTAASRAEKAARFITEGRTAVEAVA